MSVLTFLLILLTYFVHLTHSMQFLDWRDRGVVSRVKNQYICSSCRAFATTSIVESSVALNGGELLDLSEQQIIDCCKGTGADCGVGSIVKSINYSKVHGLCSENYHYLDREDTCHSCNVLAKTLEYRVLKGEFNIYQELQNGPVATNINSKILQGYNGGIINSDCDKNTDHYVTIVGYGYGKEENLTYWIVKNSWGSLWGEDGYFRIASGIGKCGIGKSVFSVNATQVAPNDYTENKFRNYLEYYWFGLDPIPKWAKIIITILILSLFITVLVLISLSLSTYCRR